jgi:hypothetical protein
MVVSDCRRQCAKESRALVCCPPREAHVWLSIAILPGKKLLLAIRPTATIGGRLLSLLLPSMRQSSGSRLLSPRDQCTCDSLNKRDWIYLGDFSRRLYCTLLCGLYRILHACRRKKYVHSTRAETVERSFTQKVTRSLVSPNIFRQMYFFVVSEISSVPYCTYRAAVFKVPERSEDAEETCAPGHSPLSLHCTRNCPFTKHRYHHCQRISIDP